MVNREGGKNPSGTGLTPGVNFCQKDYLRAGVSSDYVYDPNKQWYVLRASYGREYKAYEYLISRGVDAYYPVRLMIKQYGNVKKRVLESLLPNILFAYCTQEQAKMYVEQTPALDFLTYYINRLVARSDGKRTLPLTVRYEQLMNFIALTSIHDEHIRVVDNAHCHYKSGDRVKIVDGAFIGVEGRVARVAGQQRVIVEVEGLCKVATAYIPTAFLEIQH